MTLYYTLPFITDENGNYIPNALSVSENDVMYFPVFLSVEDLKKHHSTNGLNVDMFVKGTLKSVLSSLDSHPAIRNWGVAVNPDSEKAIGIPPFVRVTPKCLRK